MRGAGFELDPTRIGTWATMRRIPGVPHEVAVKVDLLVPEALGGGGRRGARIPPHSRYAARKARGLEAALVDRFPMLVGSLEKSDRRAIEIDVAGPAALAVAKLHKLRDRAGESDRSSDKDALDLLRLLRATRAPEMADAMSRLRTDRLAESVTREALGFAADMFAATTSPGARMAARAAFPDDPDVIAASIVALVAEMLRASGHR